MAEVSRIRMNYHKDCEAAINKQINLELYSSYVYQQMSWHYARDDVALPGMQRFFAEASLEERDHAQAFMAYQVERGGRVLLKDIPKPTKQEWNSPLEAMEAALELEKTVNQSLLDIHSLASQYHDPHLANFLENDFLPEQVKSIQQLSSLVANLRRVGLGLGEFMFDQSLLQHSTAGLHAQKPKTD